MKKSANTNTQSTTTADETSPYQGCIAPRVNQHRGHGTDRLDEWAGGRKGRADRTSATDRVNGAPVNQGRGRR